MTTINRSLNLVVPVHRDSGAVVYAHSAPISADVFSAYKLVIIKTFQLIYGMGLGDIGGPRVADELLKKAATDLGVWEGDGGVKRGLVNEIRRLTNVLVPGDKGWEALPLDDAKSRGVLDDVEIAEVEAAIAFFTATYWGATKAMREGMLKRACELWAWQIASSNCTEFLNSLRTSTETESSGGKAA